MENISMKYLTKIQYMDFYARVKQLAKKTQNQTLQEFIYSVGLNHASYYSLQRDGNLPRADEALAIAHALGTTVEYLLIGTEPEDRAKTILDDFQSLIYQHRKHPDLLKKTRK
jgi:transcriptional regulator with XRE-family HTH domain